MFSNRFKGNLVVWGVLLTVLFFPIIVLGLIFDLKERGWFWGIVEVLIALYIVNLIFPFY